MGGGRGGALAWRRFNCVTNTQPAVCHTCTCRHTRLWCSFPSMQPAASCPASVIFLCHFQTVFASLSPSPLPFLISFPLSKRFVKFEFQARHKSLISAHSFPSTSDLPQCRVSCAVCCLPRPRHPAPLHGTTNDMTVGYLSGRNTCGKSKERASNKLGASRKTTCHRLAVSLNHAAPSPAAPAPLFVSL